MFYAARELTHAQEMDSCIVNSTHKRMAGTIMSGKERTQPKSITEHPTFNIADNLGINSAQKSDL